MQRKSLPILFFCLFFVFAAIGQQQKAYKKNRILILLDASSSMVENWNSSQSRFKAAATIVGKLMDSVYSFNADVEFALRVYGHQHGVPERNCFDTRREVMFSKNNYTQMMLRLEDLRPYGVSPIAFSLKQAAEEDFNDSYNYAYSLVLITDGGESCGGNICDVVKTLLNKKIEFKPYIVSLVNYAPLREQYACLGHYLQAATPEEMNSAIGIIAEDYHKVLSIPILKVKTPETPKPAPIVIKQAPPIPEVVVTKESNPTPTKYLIKPIKQYPKPLAFKRSTFRRPQLQPRSIQPIALPIKEEEPVIVLKKDIIPAMRNTAKLRSFGLFWSTPSLKSRRIERIAIPPKEVDSPPVATTRPVVAPPVNKPIPKAPPARPTPPKVTAPPIKEATYNLKTEAAKETLLEILFTDGKGKFYSSTPQVKVLDAKTGVEVKKFFRTVDATGHPDPQKMTPGSYTLLIGKNENFRAKSVVIHPNSLNKVTIIAENGTLKFHYTNNEKRPIKEFSALVKKNFEPGPVIAQHCNEEKQYSAGSYHIEIGTLPISRRYLDIDFGVDYVIEIDEPGYVSITNTAPFGKATFYFQHGDNFTQFYTLDINGNPALQKVQLQPGYYEVRFNERGTGQPYIEKRVKFFVQSNKSTEILLP